MLDSPRSSPQSSSGQSGLWASTSPATVLLALRQTRESHAFLVNSLLTLRPSTPGVLRSDIDSWLAQLHNINDLLAVLHRLEVSVAAAAYDERRRASTDQVPDKLEERAETHAVQEPPAGEQLF